jgi:glutathione S-transferase
MVLTLFNLENSRSFRVLWLANELKVPIKSRNYARIDGKKAEPSLAKDSGYSLGKSPCLIEDGSEGRGDFLRIVESGNCMQ